MGRPYKNRHKETALALFGLKKGKMESRAEREALCNVLMHSSDKRFRMLAQAALVDITQVRQTSFTRFLETMGVPWEDVALEYTKLLKTEGLVRQAQHLPDLLEQTALAAYDREVECADCEGKGKVPGKRAYKLGSQPGGEERGEKTCRTCHGSGKITIHGDLERLKLVFENFGLTGKAQGGPLVNVDLRKIEKVEDLHDLSASVQPIIEAQVVDKGSTE